MSDPVSDLKHELLAAARRQSQGHIDGPRRLPERLAGSRLLMASTALVIAAALVFVIAAPWSSSPGFLDRAEAALTPPAGTILHQKWELTATSTDPECTVRRGPSEIWIDQEPPHRYRVQMGTLPPLDGPTDPRVLACSNWDAYELGGAFESGQTLKFEPPSTLRILPGQFSHPLDPVEELRESISAGTAHDDGTTELDGRTVRRIRVEPRAGCADCPDEPFYWYVDPETLYPVAAEGAGGLGQPGTAFVPLRVAVRYLEYEYLPRTAANLALTDIHAQHPDAQPHE